MVDGKQIPLSHFPQVLKNHNFTGCPAGNGYDIDCINYAISVKSSDWRRPSEDFLFCCLPLYRYGEMAAYGVVYP